MMTVVFRSEYWSDRAEDGGAVGVDQLNSIMLESNRSQIRFECQHGRAQTVDDGVGEVRDCS